MQIHKFSIALGLMLALVMFFELTAHADVSNELTKVTFDKPVEIPGEVLPAGTYWLQRADENDPEAIQIFNADRGAVVATVITVSADRSQPAAYTVITLAELHNGIPALVEWIYPGETIGHEFIYSKQQERQIAQAQQETYVGGKLISVGESSGE